MSSNRVIAIIIAAVLVVGLVGYFVFFVPGLFQTSLSSYPPVGNSILNIALDDTTPAPEATITATISVEATEVFTAFEIGVDYDASILTYVDGSFDANDQFSLAVPVVKNTDQLIIGGSIVTSSGQTLPIGSYDLATVKFTVNSSAVNGQVALLNLNSGSSVVEASNPNSPRNILAAVGTVGAFDTATAIITTTAVATVDPVSNLAAVGATNDTIKLTWDNPTTGLDGVLILWDANAYLTPLVTQAVNKANVTNVDAQTYTISGVQNPPGTVWKITVYAYKASGSDISYATAAKTTGQVSTVIKAEAPNPVTSFKASTKTSTIVLSWDNPNVTTTDLRVKILRGTDDYPVVVSETGTTEVTTAAGDTDNEVFNKAVSDDMTTYTDSDVTTGTTYYYTAYTENSNGVSTGSKASATIEPEVITGGSVNQTDLTIESTAHTSSSISLKLTEPQPVEGWSNTPIKKVILRAIGGYPSADSNTAKSILNSNIDSSNRISNMTDSGLTASTTYYYIAYLKDSTGATSNVAKLSVTTDSAGGTNNNNNNGSTAGIVTGKAATGPTETLTIVVAVLLSISVVYGIYTIRTQRATTGATNTEGPVNETHVNIKVKRRRDPRKKS